MMTSRILNTVCNCLAIAWRLFYLNQVIIITILIDINSINSLLLFNTTATMTTSRQQMISHDLITVQGDQRASGYILSPNYPNSPPADSVAIATLRSNSPALDAIRLTFDEFNLQVANNCEGQALNVFLIDHHDNALDPKKLIYSLCGSSSSSLSSSHLQPVLVYSQNLVLQFVSDEFISLRANYHFRIGYEFLDSKRQLYKDCPQPGQFRCRNRRCISSELKCNHFDDCGDASDEDLWTPCEELPTIPYKIDYQCGLASFGSSLIDRENQQVTIQQPLLAMNRIVGGNAGEVVKRSLPQVSIQLLTVEPMSHMCGGALIHPMFVLTSAHCFKDNLAAANHRLLFGVQDLRRAHASSGVQVRYANHVSFYPSYSYKLPEYVFNYLERANNLALVELNAPVVMNAHVWPACLPHLSEPIGAGRECVIMGFGETRGSGRAYELKQLKQSITHASECKSQLSEFEIDDYSMICVANQHSAGPCKGDSGGPLLCRDDERSLPIKQLRPVNVSEPEATGANDLEPGDVIEFLNYQEEGEAVISNQLIASNTRHQQQSRYTIYGVTSFTTDGNLDGGYCGLKEAPTIYARVSTRIEWILSVLKLALPRLNKADNFQDNQIYKEETPFGYMFRTGHSQHVNYTWPMTIKQGQELRGS